jgi:hypothetical protein
VYLLPVALRGNVDKVPPEAAFRRIRRYSPEQRYDVFLSYENAQTLTTGQIYFAVGCQAG